jgi:AcrR family transcriptional regulator
MVRMPAEERRELVIAAGIVEFAKGGLEGTSTEVIARRADISQPYLFRLFPTKKALFLACVQRVYDRVTRLLMDAADGLHGDDALQAMGEAYRSFLEDRTLLLTQMHAFAACDDDEVRVLTQSCFGKLWLAIADASGADDEQLVTFIAFGMLLNVAAAMDLTSAMDLPWVEACLGPKAHLLPPTS